MVSKNMLETSDGWSASEASFFLWTKKAEKLCLFSSFIRALDSICTKVFSKALSSNDLRLGGKKGWLFSGQWLSLLLEGYTRGAAIPVQRGCCCCSSRDIMDCLLKLNWHAKK